MSGPGASPAPASGAPGAAPGARPSPPSSGIAGAAPGARAATASVSCADRDFAPDWHLKAAALSLVVLLACLFAAWKVFL